MRRRFRIALAIYTVSHLYIWWRLILPLPSPTWQVGTAILALLGPTFPAEAATSKQQERTWLCVP